MVDLEDIKDISIACSNRYTYDGKNVPRVTEIIQKMIHEDYIVTWANGLGFKHLSYHKVLNEAANFGTKTHSAIETYLKEDKEYVKLHTLNAFKLWWNQLNSYNNVKILGQEERLVCPYFGGTYDLLISINDAIYLVDFKTSNHVTYKYYLQLAAYNYILKSKGINITGVVILQLSKTEDKYTEYVLDFRNPIHKDYFEMCERTFLTLVYAYYHVYYLEGKFNELKKDTYSVSDGHR